MVIRRGAGQVVPHASTVHSQDIVTQTRRLPSRTSRTPYLTSPTTHTTSAVAPKTAHVLTVTHHEGAGADRADDGACDLCRRRGAGGLAAARRRSVHARLRPRFTHCYDPRVVDLQGAGSPDVSDSILGHLAHHHHLDHLSTITTLSLIILTSPAFPLITPFFTPYHARFPWSSSWR